MLDQILAKYQKNLLTGEIKTETLVEHTECVLESLVVLKKRTLGLSNDFWRAAYITCLFHDSGKISDNFQSALSGQKDENIRHELLSGVFCLYFDRSFLNDNSFFALAIFSHHKPLNNSLFDEHLFRSLQLKGEYLKEWFSFASQKLDEANISYQNLNENVINKLLSYSTESYKAKVFLPFFDNLKSTWKQKDRFEYIHAKAVLNISDWSASGHFELSKPLVYSEETLLGSLYKKLINEGKSTENLSFRKFQTDSNINSNVLAIAPTGSGKTEASLIWASQKNEYEKTIYCLPTRVTSNAIYERLIEYFENDNCSVVHSSALLYKKEVDPDYESRRYLRDKTFFSNITVCTIDQLLTQGFNLGFWEVKTFHCKNARIIIDEIHLYSPYTLALILETIKYLREYFGTRFFIMSATMPVKLQDLLSDALGGKENFKFIQDSELLEKSRNTFETTDLTIQENLPEIKKAIYNRDKVLIVVNTVDQAIALYQELKHSAEEIGKRCICFHSRFIQKDRQKIETDILNMEKEGKPILLIATQVVEVSLDIDFDVLYTENAPIDAIIQRAGRINRKRNPDKESKVIVHSHSEASQKFIYTEADILDKTFQVLSQYNGRQITENEFLELVDQVYQNVDVTQKLSFKEGEKAFYQVQSTYHFLGDCPPDSESAMTRDGLDTVSVIPSRFYEELNILKSDKYKKVKYELSISRNRFSSVKKTFDNEGFKYVEYDYIEDIGLIYPPHSKASSNKAISF
ncbi:CRISPR-associated helicase Cas3' [Algoriphagus pacificus]|uniref:CRISPR-associated helicase Cas3 n=1 Tax=Algoriphagus pacificus TaxID=2811234 RepID=A0ABS3CNI3_9BACT|nr:CRISPR-associated helicase Cas3' [Algoriphagus pacificus]MBN7818084.1 CRISPR-associated helicase Cas3' [Algoriphagus pacificus]